ncbi:MAG: class I SAM-dependent methyltransferase [Candidatus Dormibacteria bacterium]
MTLAGAARPALPTAGEPEPEAVRGMFAELAGRYDLLNSLLSQGQDRRWRRRAAQLTRTVSGDRVLDVCSGTGALTRLLCQRVAPGGEVVGLDLTEAMIEVARIRAPGVQFVVGDACHLPFPDGHFDAATMAFGLRNICAKQLALAELRRVLRPDGRVVILEFSTVVSPLRASYAWYSRHLIPRIAAVVLGRDGAYRYLTESIAAFPPPRAVSGWLLQAGFDRVRHHSMTGGVVALHVARRPSGAGGHPEASPLGRPGPGG